MSDFNTFYRPRPFLSLLDTKRQVWRKLSVNKCFLAKSPVGSLPFVHREISHCGEISVRARVLPRETQRRGTLLAGFHFRSEGNATSLGSSHGGAVERSETEGVALL